MPEVEAPLGLRRDVPALVTAPGAVGAGSDQAACFVRVGEQSIAVETGLVAPSHCLSVEVANFKVDVNNILNIYFGAFTLFKLFFDE